jgi:hypothetical protein
MSKTSREISILSIVQARPKQSEQAEKDEVFAIQQATGAPSISTKSKTVVSSRTTARKSDATIINDVGQTTRGTSSKQVSRTSSRAQKKGLRKPASASKPAPFGADSAIRAKKRNIKAKLGQPTQSSARSLPKKLKVKKITIS